MAVRPEVEEARRLYRETGLSFERIGKRLGVSASTAYRWCRPEYAASSRKTSRMWKRRNRERVRAYSKRYYKENRKPCSECGEPMGGEALGEVCKVCIERAADERRKEIVRLWSEDISVRRIAEIIGTTPGAIGVQVAKMRKEGHDLPHRRRPSRSIH